MARPVTPDERRQHLAGFVGREDVIAEIDQQLHAGTSWILLRGAPGMGKTALVAAYLDRLETQGIVGALDQTLSLFRKAKGPSASDRPIVQLTPHLYTKKQGNRRLVPNTFLRRTATKRESSRDVARSLAQQVEFLFPTCAQPESTGADGYLSDLLGRVSKVLEASGQRLVLLVDGIDQCAGAEAPNPFARRLPDLPPGISVICSSRPLRSAEFQWMMDSSSYCCIDLDSSRWVSSNNDICLRFLEKVREELPEEADLDIDRAVVAASGCIRYLVDLVSTLKDHPTAPLERAPHRFRGFLEEMWDMVNALPDELRSAARTGLEYLSSEAEAVPRTELVAKAGWDAPGLDTFLTAARPFLVKNATNLEDPSYAIFHPSFSQFIAETLLLERTMPSVRRRGLLDKLGKSQPSTPRRVGARYFLGVGADDYNETALKLGYCGNDARALSALLGERGYTTAALHDTQEDRAWRPTMFNIKTALDALKNRFDADDLLWIHFSCHGVLAQGKPYLLATDSRSTNAAETGLSIDSVLRYIKASGTKRWLLTLDACHAGVEIGRDATAPADLDEAFVRNVYELADSGAVLAASTASQTAADSNDSKHGVFSQALLDALSGKADRAQKGFITLDDLKDEVVDAVRRWNFGHLGLGEPQTPSFRIEGTGDLILIDGRVTPAAPQAPSPS